MISATARSAAPSVIDAVTQFLPLAARNARPPDPSAARWGGDSGSEAPSSVEVLNLNCRLSTQERHEDMMATENGVPWIEVRSESRETGAQGEIGVPRSR